MKRPSNIQQTVMSPPQNQQNDSKIKFIKRSISQAEAAQQNIDSYYKSPLQSLEKIKEAPPRKPLSRKNSGMSPLIKNQLRAPRADCNEITPPRKFNTVEEIAMHMAANIFMIATTKFVPGFDDLSSLSGEARSYRKSSASPLKPRDKAREGQSMPPNKQEKVDPKRSTVTPPNKHEKVDPKRPTVIPSRVVESSLKPSMVSGTNYQSPKFNQMSDMRGKSRLQESFDEIASQNASKVSRSQVRIREIQPNEIVHVPSGIRTKVQQQNSSLVKSQTPKNPESSIHRINEKVYVNAARYGQQINTPRPDASHSPTPTPRERAISQPAQKVNAYKPQPQPVSPKKPQENWEEPSILKMGDVTPTKPGAAPLKSTTPIKSTIGLELQSKTDLPKPFNPYAQRNLNNQANQNSQANQSASQNIPARSNRFQNEVKKQITPQAQVPAKSPVMKTVVEEQKIVPSAARYGRQSSIQPERVASVEPKSQFIARGYPYNDTIIKQIPQKPATQKQQAPSITSSRIAKSVQASAYHMASQTYFNSTTKFNKAVGVSSKNIDSPPKKEVSTQKLPEKSIPQVKPSNPQAYNPYQPKPEALRPSLNNSRPLNASESKKQENASPPKHTIQPIKPYSRPQSQARPQSIQKEASPEPAPTAIAQAYQNRTNRFQTEPVKKEEERSTSRNGSKSIEREISNGNKRQIKISQQEKSIPPPVTQTQYRANSLSRTQPVTVQKDASKTPGKIDASQSIQKDESATPKAAPFSRQPAGSRSPLLFTNKPEEKQANQEVKARTSPAFNRNNKKPEGSNRSIHPNVSEKSIKIVTATNVSSMPSIPINNRIQQSPAVQGPIQGSQPNRNKKEPEPTSAPVQRYGAKGLQSKPTEDSSFQSGKNTTNTLAASKSTSAIERVWRPVQNVKPTNVKDDISNSIQHEQVAKKIEQKGYQKGTQASNQQPRPGHKPVQSDDSIKVQPQKAPSRQNIPRNIQPTSFKSIPSGDISDKKSPATKHPAYHQPSAKNVTVNSTNATQSPQTSTVQSHVKPSTNNYMAQPQYNRPSKAVTQASSPQPISAKIIPTSPSLSRETPQIKSESHINAVNIREVKQAKNTEDEAKQEPSNLQKSLAVVYSVSKLKVKAKKQSFSIIKEKGSQQVKHIKQAAILVVSAQALVSILLKNNYSKAFQNMKKNFISKFKANKENVAKSEHVKESAASVIGHLLIFKRRESWNQIKQSSWINKQIGITHSPREIDLKNRDLLDKTQVQKRFLSSFVFIAKSVNSAHLRKGFDKIMLEALRGIAQNRVKELSGPAKSGHQTIQARSPPQRPSRDYEALKKSILDQKTDIENQMANVEYRMNDLKRVNDREKGKLINKMEEFRKKNSKFQTEVSSKRKQNQVLKKTLEKCPESEDLLPEGEPLLDLLTQIYVQIYRNSQEIIDPSGLIKKYSLNKEDLNPIVEEWNTLVQHLNLKTQICLWEGVTSTEGKVAQALKKQKEVEVSLMRTYVRERYLWEWVHTASAHI